ncbi:MAG: hypothetical protein OEZ52_11600 [Candidatus Aminicenantes bacterium]|nr:hypothetical protein [Candidatus Aminicenantes bacterium]MDH5744184.1 hypothetical protein [Candidatus Aminicenantes bacterium]
MKKKSMPLVHVALVFLFLVQGVYALQAEQGTEVPLIFDKGLSGKIEVAVYYGRWSLNLFKGLFKDELIDEISTEVQDEIINQVRQIRKGRNMVPTNYEQTFAFDSGGPNYGLEVRFYPQGRDGAFSLGFSLDKTKIRLTIQGDVRQDFDDGSFVEVKEAVGEINLNPLFTNLNFRWDFKPEWRVTPYFIFGVGVAVLNGEVSYDWIGLYRWGVFEESVGESETMSIKEAEEEPDVDFNLPNIIPLLQMNLGVRAEVIPHLHLRAEVGIWDGFVFRAGMAYRF